MTFNMIKIEELTDNVAFITQDGKGISKRDFIEHIAEGWITYLVTLPLNNKIVEEVAITTHKNKKHHTESHSDALEYFQNYKDEDLSEEELSIINVNVLSL
ncbi:hypothetical protein MZM54_02215 [[Brevibacterium] frigoritolerans]|nr:hypothetical protein [Peribacillus frigoritolerans]